MTLWYSLSLSLMVKCKINLNKFYYLTEEWYHYIHQNASQLNASKLAEIPQLLLQADWFINCSCLALHFIYCYAESRNVKCFSFTMTIDTTTFSKMTLGNMTLNSRALIMALNRIVQLVF